jgi:hypothetical protein
MEDVALAGQAVPALSAKIEALHAGLRHADCIRIVTMRRKWPAVEARFHALDTFSAGAIPDAVSTSHAVSSWFCGFAGAI